MKTCRMMFYSDYVSDEQLIKAVQNSSHLDKCYIGLYEKNWNGTTHQSLNDDLLHSLGGNTEIVFLTDEQMHITGKESPNTVETHCRNYILEKSKSENFDLMIVQDTDEFLCKEDYDFMMNDYFPTMFAQGYDSCAIRLKNFWKSWKHILVCEEELVPEWPGEWANFGIRIQPETKFLEIRQHTSIQKCGVKQPCYLYHGTFVHTDENVKKKIRSWGHSNDIDFDVWYRDKWLNWTLETTDLHPSIRPSIWKRAVEYTGNLPEQL